MKATGSSQAISATREYDAFGNVTSSTGTHTGRFGYGGPYGYQEDEGGLKQLGHRLYDPVCGRFVTKDPIKDGRNWYGYCNNNPLILTDPTGQLTIAGDTGGIAGWAWLAPGNWPSHNNLTKEEVIKMLIETDDDSVGIWGHGMKGRIYINEDEYLTSDDIKAIARERKRRGKKKLKSITINECDVCQDANMVNALLELSDEVNGFSGMTGYTPRKTWKRPITADDPSLKPGGWAGPKKGKLKPGKVPGKATR